MKHRNLFLHLGKNPRSFLLLVCDVILEYQGKTMFIDIRGMKHKTLQYYTGNEHNMWDPHLPLSPFLVTCYFATLDHPVSGPPSGS